MSTNPIVVPLNFRELRNHMFLKLMNNIHNDWFKLQSTDKLLFLLYLIRTSIYI